MLSFLASTLITALGVAAFLDWSGRQAERQIDRMQEAAFNTPGAEAPLPPQVMLGGLAIALVHFVAARLLGVHRGWAFFSLLIGGALGGLLFWRGAPKHLR